MSSDDTFRNEPGSDFSFGVSEMRQAYEAEVRRLATAPGHDPRESRGFDPYNSGGFDRNRAWARKSKR